MTFHSRMYMCLICFKHIATLPVHQVYPPRLYLDIHLWICYNAQCHVTLKRERKTPCRVKPVCWHCPFVVDWTSNVNCCSPKKVKRGPHSFSIINWCYVYINTYKTYSEVTIALHLLPTLLIQLTPLLPCKKVHWLILCLWHWRGIMSLLYWMNDSRMNRCSTCLCICDLCKQCSSMATRGPLMIYC